MFTPADHAARTTSFFLNEKADTAYTSTVQYHFDPSAGWDGHEVEFETTAPTTDRTLLLNPFEHFEFVTVDIEPGRVDDELVSALDVELALPTSSGTPVRRTFTVKPGGKTQQWRARTDLVDQRAYSVTTTAHLTDGSTRTAPPFTTSAPLLSVDDPLTDALDIELIPLLDPAASRLAIVDILYDDASSNYHRSERVTVPAEQRDLIPLRLALMDPTKRDFSFRLTVVGVDGSLRRDAFVTTTDTLVAVRSAHGRGDSGEPHPALGSMLDRVATVVPAGATALRADLRRVLGPVRRAVGAGRLDLQPAHRQRDAGGAAFPDGDGELRATVEAAAPHVPDGDRLDAAVRATLGPAGDAVTPEAARLLDDVRR